MYLWDKRYEHIKHTSNNESAGVGLKSIMDNQLEFTAFLSLCFSDNNDSLHMWNAYADGGGQSVLTMKR